VEQTFDGVDGPVLETRPFSPGDKVFKSEDNSDDSSLEREIVVRREVKWEFTRP
jgi:hypothetical protein